MAKKLKGNDLCYCGSGLKYKKCCAKRAPWELTQAYQYEKKYGILLKTDTQICGIRKAGALVAGTLDLVEQMIKPGITTREIDDFVHKYTIENNAVPAPLGYKGFPKSCCTSLNSVICHGIPDETPLKQGDIINVDITSILDGYYADASRTFPVGTVSEAAQKLITAAKECLDLAIGVCAPGVRLMEIGRVIQDRAKEDGFSVVKDYVGHGVGLKFHENPQVLHYFSPAERLELAMGMTFTIEPMINQGTWEQVLLNDGWTSLTKDNSLSAQFEHTLAITAQGVEILTI